MLKLEDWSAVRPQFRNGHTVFEVNDGFVVIEDVTAIRQIRRASGRALLRQTAANGAVLIAINLGGRLTEESPTLQIVAAVSLLAIGVYGWVRFGRDYRAVSGMIEQFAQGRLVWDRAASRTGIYPPLTKKPAIVPKTLTSSGA